MRLSHSIIAKIKGKGVLDDKNGENPVQPSDMNDVMVSDRKVRAHGR